MKTIQKNNLILIACSLLVTGGLFFLGLQMRANSNLQASSVNTAAPAEISEEAILAAMEKMQQKQQADAAQAKAQQEQQKQEMAKNNLVKPNDSDYVRGNPDAAITIIEYSDYECPYCKQFHETMKEVVATNKDDVNWIYRHFPLAFHNPLASKEAEAAECVGSIAGNDAFWEYTDLIYDTTKSNNGLELTQLPILAEQIGVDVAKFTECYEAGTFTEKVQQQLAEGSKAGVSGTPGSIILNNKTGDVKLISGALPAEMIQKEIDALK